MAKNTTGNSGNEIGPVEWPVASEDDFRQTLPKMLAYRKMILRQLGLAMGGRFLFSAFLRGEQAHIRADSIFDAAAAMDMEVVFRPVATDKSRQRIEAVKANTLKQRAAVAAKRVDDLQTRAQAAEDASK